MTSAALALQSRYQEELADQQLYVTEFQDRLTLNAFAFNASVAWFPHFFPKKFSTTFP